MKTKFVKKPVLDIIYLSQSVENYILKKYHLSKVLNVLKESDINTFKTYLTSVLKFYSLSANLLNQEESDKKYNDVIKPLYYLLLVILFIEQKGFSLKSDKSFKDKIYSFFVSKHSNGKESTYFNIPEFSNNKFLLKEDSFNIESYSKLDKNSISVFSIAFFNLTFYVKNNQILFFKKGILLPYKSYREDYDYYQTTKYSKNNYKKEYYK